MVNSYHLSQRSLTCGLCCSAAQGWHHDGDSHYGPEVEILQVMYYPQSTPLEKGPTEVLPGSHFLPDSESANALDASPTHAPVPPWHRLQDLFSSHITR